MKKSTKSNKGKITAIYVRRSVSDKDKRNHSLYINGKISNMDRSHSSRLLESPLYVRADKEVYKFFASQGVEMLDDISAYDGVHGLFLHGKHHENAPTFIKVGYHEGLVDSETWLAVQDKKAHTQKFHGKNKVMVSWLSGLIKCAHCGYSLTVTYRHNASRTKTWRYLRDTGYFKRLGWGALKAIYAYAPKTLKPPFSMR